MARPHPTLWHMSGYQVDDATAEDIAEEVATYRPVADALRVLADLSIRTTVSAQEAEAARGHLLAAAEILSRQAEEGPYGVRHSTGGAGLTRAFGNSVVGVRNPVAPPLQIVRAEDGVHADFSLSSQYEGPPNLVHGGVLSMILDQLLGEAAAAAGKPGMTGTLTIRYRRATPLGALRGEAKVDRVEGIKTYAVGQISDAEGVTVEAEGVFILPKWAREARRAPERFD